MRMLGREIRRIGRVSPDIAPWCEAEPMSRIVQLPLLVMDGADNLTEVSTHSLVGKVWVTSTPWECNMGDKG